MNWLQKIAYDVEEDEAFNKAEQYFAIGHGDFNEETGIQSSFQVWVFLNGEIQTSDVIKINKRTGNPVGGGTHGSLWGHDACNRTYKGRYEVETGILSIVKPCGKEKFPIPQFVQDALHEAFPYITRIAEF